MSNNNTGTELMPILDIPSEKAMEIFSTEGGVQPYIDIIKGHATPQVFDMSVRKDRESLRTLAAAITKSKTFLAEAGKEQADIAKTKPKLIDAERRRVAAEMTAYRDEIRQPLTDWENNEAARKERIKNNIKGFAKEGIEEWPSERLEKELAALNAVDVSEGFDEFSDLAQAKLDRATLVVNGLIKIRADEAAEEKKLEAERLKREEENRVAREKKIAKDATVAAEKKAKDEAKAVQAAADLQETQLKLANERLAREAAQSEADRLEAEAKAAKDILEAESRAKQEVKDEEHRVAAEAAKREKDAEHNAKINNTALDALIASKVDPMEAKKAIIAIAQKKIPAVTISY